MNLPIGRNTIPKKLLAVPGVCADDLISIKKNPRKNMNFSLLGLCGAQYSCATLNNVILESIDLDCESGGGGGRGEGGKGEEVSPTIPVILHFFPIPAGLRR